MSVVSVLRLSVGENAVEEFAGRFAELGIFERARESGGFTGGRLLRSLTCGDQFVVFAEWESVRAYKAWLENPIRAELGAQLEPLLLDEVGAGELFEEG